MAGRTVTMASAVSSSVEVLEGFALEVAAAVDAAGRPSQRMSWLLPLAAQMAVASFPHQALPVPA